MQTFCTLSDVPRQLAAWRGVQKKVTNYFIFDQLYIPEHKETMMTLASNSKSFELSQKGS